MRNLAAIALIAAAIAIPLLFGGNDYVMGLMVSGLIVAGVALAWALLGNLGGMVSFGHAAFFGVGAYTSALLAARTGLPVPLSLLCGGLGAALCSLAMLPALRLSGPYFALAILAYAHIFKILATEASAITGGSAGLARFPTLPTIAGIDFSSRVGSYCLLVAMVVACALLYLVVKRSHVGTALRAPVRSTIPPGRSCATASHGRWRITRPSAAPGRWVNGSPRSMASQSPSAPVAVCRQWC